MDQRVVVIGAGGHAAVVIDTLRRSGAGEPAACVDDDPSLHGASVLGVPVVGAIDRLAALASEGLGRFMVGVGGANHLSIRSWLFDRATADGLQPASAVHPAAMVGESVAIGEGSLVTAGAIVNPRVAIGRDVIINSGAIVEHDCRIGDHAHVAPGAMLAGGVCVGDSVLIGMGASVRQGVTIGSGAIVGMGAVVTDDVADGAVVVGCPARPR